jgi:hypothetical protein
MIVEDELAHTAAEQKRRNAIRSRNKFQNKNQIIFINLIY